jgi:DNA-binding CsgD family transcriptional regulator
LNGPTPAARKPKVATRERAIRHDRIFARMLVGQSYQAIAAAEAITPRRLRKLVQDALQKDNVNPRNDFVVVEIARLEGALRLIEQKWPKASSMWSTSGQSARTARPLPRPSRAAAIARPSRSLESGHAGGNRPLRRRSAASRNINVDA